MVDAKNSAPASADDDLFDEVSAYLTKKDVEGCLVSFLANEPRRTIKTTGPDGKPSTFDMIMGSLVVIAGRPSEEFVQQKGEKLPVLLENFAITGVQLIDRAEQSLSTHKPKLGRWKGKPNRHKGTSFEWNQDKLSDADKNAARTPAVRALMERQIELHNEATTKADLFEETEPVF